MEVILKHENEKKLLEDIKVDDSYLEAKFVGGKSGR